MHDVTVGMEAATRKEEIQCFIEDQLGMEEGGLDKRGHYLLGIDLEDFKTSTGEDQHYWLLQTKAVRYDLVLRR